MEVGLGIHGEKGLQRLPLESSKDIVKRMLRMFERFIGASDEVVILLNNLGSTTPLEMSQLSVDILRET
jgi:dihydroxyacetone kinase